MVIFDKTDNNKGTFQGTIHLQGMDIAFFLQHFDREFLVENITPDFLEYFVTVVQDINEQENESLKEFHLRESHHFNIEFSEEDICFKQLIGDLVQNNILYSKKILSFIPKDEVTRKIKELESSSDDILENDPLRDYELASMKFVNYVNKQTITLSKLATSPCNNNIHFKNKDTATRAAKNIEVALQTMGLRNDIIDSDFDSSKIQQSQKTVASPKLVLSKTQI